MQSQRNENKRERKEARLCTRPALQIYSAILGSFSTVFLTQTMTSFMRHYNAMSHSR